jgi:hypothetical protein
MGQMSDLDIVLHKLVECGKIEEARILYQVILGSLPMPSYLQDREEEDSNKEEIE